MIDAYKELFKAGLAHSVEVWNQKGELVGGLYGVKILDKVYSGESMFHKESNTSKLAFIHLAQMAQKDNIDLIDCQLYTPHLESLGARKIPRAAFMRFLQD
jgi:leucyl/phenylalanyl-tRNA--protein transferase